MSMVNTAAAPVSATVTGLPATPPVTPQTVAVRYCRIGTPPNLQLPTCAMPFASVVVTPPVTLPAPGPVTANVSATPETGTLLASATRTAGPPFTGYPP